MQGFGLRQEEVCPLVKELCLSQMPATKITTVHSIVNHAVVGPASPWASVKILSPFDP